MISRRVGRYLVCDEIASGGMATVHFGRMIGEAGFSRTVAIKRLHDSYAKDPDFVAMFVDEARVAARIHHPNVVDTLDVVDAGGALLLVMEYLHGESLSRLLKCAARDGEAVPLDVASAIVCDALLGLHAAHEATTEAGAPLDLVHRDVSPQNIFVGADGITRVVDFGIAKAMGRVHTTREGQLKGKLAYMAPEQIVGGAVDRRADVYATGVVLWEMLTGRSLFRGENEAATMRNALDKPVPAPSEVVASVPPAIDGVVLRALARDKGERYATAREMARALEACVAPASARKIAEWVDVLAGDRLAERKRRLVEIERAPVPDPRAEVSTAALALEPAPVSRASRSRTAAIAASVGVAGVAACIAIYVASTGSKNTPSSGAVAAPIASAEAPPAIPTPPRTTSAPLVAAASIETAAVTTLPAPSVASSTSRARAPKPRGECQVRSYVDRDGITQFRRDCGR